jgi:hypothetical protein
LFWASWSVCLSIHSSFSKFSLNASRILFIIFFACNTCTLLFFRSTFPIDQIRESWLYERPEALMKATKTQSITACVFIVRLATHSDYTLIDISINYRIDR